MTKEKKSEIKFISIEEALKQGKGKVSIRGWAHRERGSAKVKFIVLRDSTDIVQCVVKPDSKYWEEAQKVTVESSLEITGTLHKDERAPTGYELQVEELKVVHVAEPFPITRDVSPEFLYDQRHLYLRSRKLTAIMKIRSTVFRAIDEYFKGEGFHEYHSPIFQAVQCEGGSSLFEVKYFDKKDVFLAQTWQLYAEPAIFALEKIYTIAPSFRAEKSVTSRHLTEYWHAEMEFAWSTFKEVQDYGEALIKYVFSEVLKHHKKDLEQLGRDIKKLEPIVKKAFKRMTYDEALELLDKKCGMKIAWGKDLRTIEEDKLSALFDVPLIITHYPKIVKAFYMKEVPGFSKHGEVVEGCDFIGTEGYGEIIGGSQREDDLETLKKKLIEEGEKLEDYEFYLDTRKYGSVPHGGFGLGVERLISWICGLESIRDAIPFPRTPIRYKP